MIERKNKKEVKKWVIFSKTAIKLMKRCVTI
jgi:hypothetical protein